MSSFPAGTLSILNQITPMVNPRIEEGEVGTETAGEEMVMYSQQNDKNIL